MGIGASFTVLFVTGFFSAMYWLLSRPSAGAREAKPAVERKASDAAAG